MVLSVQSIIIIRSQALKNKKQMYNKMRIRKDGNCWLFYQKNTEIGRKPCEEACSPICFRLLLFLTTNRNKYKVFPVAEIRT